MERERQDVVTNPETDVDWPGRLPPKVEAVILEAVEMIHELDDTRLEEMTPIFYQHGYEQAMMSLRELLTLLGHDPDA
ncbi:hypothetical protein [Arthrobacter sp. NyZ413]|uniref:hypothetical protein n=1 Tax=Arthrobacter sp. NyZ413 TaxID=3144669 RepID=UPI003BF8DD15